MEEELIDLLKKIQGKPNKKSFIAQLTKISEEYNFDPNQMFCADWYTLLSEESIRQSLFCDQQSVDNQIRRAKILVRMLEVDQKKTSVTLMDGHGRFLYCFLEVLLRSKSERVRNIEIIVVEKDDFVHQWHELFFPQDVKKVKGDIFKQTDRCSESNLFYFNFCGIGGEKGRLRLINFLNSQVYSPGDDCCLVSFSSRKNQGTTHDLFPPDQARKYLIEKMTLKMNYLTYKFSRNDEPELEPDKAMESYISTLGIKALREFINLEGCKITTAGDGRNLAAIQQDLKNHLRNKLSEGWVWHGDHLESF
jgi:hypothetical protein